MTRTIVFVMTLMSILPFDGSAQAVPSPGDRVRIRQVDGTVLTGTLITLSPETIQLSVGSAGRMAEVLLARIEVLEASLGRRRNYPKYIGITVAVTSILGATLAGITEQPCNPIGICDGPDTSEWLYIGFTRGAIIGLPLGVVIGTVIKEERWNPFSLPVPSASGLTIRPVIGSRVGFAASVRVGGL